MSKNMRVYNRLLCRSLSFDCFEWRNGINSYNRNETVYTLNTIQSTQNVPRGSAPVQRLQLFGSCQFGSVGQKTVVGRSVFLKTHEK